MTEELTMDQEFERMANGYEPEEHIEIEPEESIQEEADVQVDEPVVEDVPLVYAEPEQRVSEVDWEQKYRSLKGIMDAELRRLHEEIDSVKKIKVEPEPVRMSNKVIEEFWETYPDLKEPLLAVIEETINVKLSAFEAAKVAPIKSTVVDNELQRFIDQIAQVHPDWDTVLNSEDYNTWKMGMPIRQQKAIDQIVAQGTAYEIIELLSDFKEHRSKARTYSPQQIISTVTTPKPDPRIDKIKAASAVPSSASIAPVQQDEDNLSFEEMFNKMVKEGGA